MNCKPSIINHKIFSLDSEILSIEFRETESVPETENANVAQSDVKFRGTQRKKNRIHYSITNSKPKPSPNFKP